jgi:hypothetical protein
MYKRRILGSTLLACIVSCSSVTEVEAPELALVVERDVVGMSAGVPAALVERLASSRVVVVGEVHFLQEHRAFVSALVRALHARGFRQLLMEWPHAFDWVLMEYAFDGEPVPGWAPPKRLGGVLIDEVRAFNRTLPSEDRVRLGAIDVNLDDYGGAEAFRGSLRSIGEQLSSPGPLQAFLAGRYEGAERQRRMLDGLTGELVEGRDQWISEWGEGRYRAILEMVEFERASVPVRALRADRYDVSARLREEAIHRVADLRIAEVPGGTLINIGLTHAQKSGLFGTASTTWLSDYLTHESAVTAGSAFVLGAVAAEVETSPDGGRIQQLDGSPTNELLRLMHEAWPSESAFLPLDDPLFSSNGVPLNIGGAVYLCAPKEVFDGIVLFPLAHRDPG